MDAQHLIALRAQKDQFFKNDPRSPLSPQQQAAFEGLSYYVYNPRLDVVVAMTPFDEKRDVQIQTTTGESRWYRRVGEVRFAVGAQEARLTIYETPHGYFLPFVDASAVQETYPAGRYLEPDVLDDGRLHLDFNQAYNPFCAYGPQWSCPITPPENRLTVAIQAGEKIPVGEWVEHE
ncbi:DUF1684 domain-containing protein [bacterium]|nr:DUF1684 domain-containing protein [bacterium]